MACGWLVVLLHCCNITMFLCFFKEPNTHSKAHSKAKDSDKVSLLHNSAEEKEKEKGKWQKNDTWIWVGQNGISNSNLDK